MVGYSGSVFISDDQAGSTWHLIPVNGSSSNRTRKPIVSSSGFGGNSDISNVSAAVSGPRAYDWSEYTLSLDFEPTKSTIHLLFNWMNNRREYRKVRLFPRYGSHQYYDECYLQSINFSGSQGSNISCSISISPVARDESIAGNWVLGQDYLSATSRTGSTSVASMSALLAETWRASESTGPIPYWASSMNIDLTNTVQLVQWSWDFNNNMSFRFLCQGHYTSAQSPYYALFGMPEVGFSTTMVLTPFTATTYSILSTLTDKKLTLVTDSLANEYSIMMAELLLDTDDDSIKGISEISSVDLKYTARGKVTLASV